MDMEQSYDVLVIGDSPNGYACAAYLAQKGHSVLLTGRQHIVNGEAVSGRFYEELEEVPCTHTSMMISPQLVRDLKLNDHFHEDFTQIKRGILCPTTGSKFLYQNTDRATTQLKIGDFNVDDASRFHEFMVGIEKVVNIYKSVADSAPSELSDRQQDLWAAAKLAEEVAKAPTDVQDNFALLTSESLKGYLDKYFTSDILKGFLAFEALIGNNVSPTQKGSALLLTHRLYNRMPDYAETKGQVRGSLYAITRALRKAAVNGGVDVEDDVYVEELLVDNDAVTGAKLTNGSDVKVQAVAASLNASRLFTQLIAKDHVPESYLARVKKRINHSGTFGMTVALSGMPEFISLKEITDLHLLNGTVTICPAIDTLTKGYIIAKAKGMSEEPAISLCFPSVHNIETVPDGQHIMQVYAQYFNAEKGDPEAFANHLLNVIAEYAPGIQDLVLGKRIISSNDVDYNFGQLSSDFLLDDLGIEDAILRWRRHHARRHRTPINGLFLCGCFADVTSGIVGETGHYTALQIDAALQETPQAVSA